LSDTDAVPTVVPPEQFVGALDCGPNTLNVIVPVGEAPPESDAEIDEGEIALPDVSEDGADTETPGDAWPTVVSVIPDPHVDAVGLLFESPP
jgi:hypothetical protein